MKPVSSSPMPGPASTGALKVSCCKAVTLRGVMEPVESPFTAKRLVGSSFLSPEDVGEAEAALCFCSMLIDLMRNSLRMKTFN